MHQKRKGGLHLLQISACSFQAPRALSGPVQLQVIGGSIQGREQKELLVILRAHVLAHLWMCMRR